LAKEGKQRGLGNIPSRAAYQPEAREKGVKKKKKKNSVFGLRGGNSLRVAASGGKWAGARESQFRRLALQRTHSRDKKKGLKRKLGRFEKKGFYEKKREIFNR